MDERDDCQLKEVTRVIQICVFAMYMTQHWIFISQYFKVALMFDLVLKNSKAGIPISDGIQMREWISIFVNFLAFAAILATTIVQIMITSYEASEAILCSWWVLSNTILSVMVTFSMLKIRRFTKQMNQSGIFANEKLMLVHVCSYLIASQINSAKNIIGVKTAVIAEVPGDYSVPDARLKLAHNWLNVLENPFWTFVNFTMLVFILKYSKPLSHSEEKASKQKFLLVFNANQESFVAMGQRQNHEIKVQKAQKKK